MSEEEKIVEITEIAPFTKEHVKILRQRIRDKREKEILMQALGWMYAEACFLADSKIDIRLIPVPVFIEKAEKDLLKEQEPK